MLQHLLRESVLCVLLSELNAVKIRVRNVKNLLVGIRKGHFGHQEQIRVPARFVQVKRQTRFDRHIGEVLHLQGVANCSPANAATKTLAIKGAEDVSCDGHPFRLL